MTDAEISQEGRCYSRPGRWEKGLQTRMQVTSRGWKRWKEPQKELAC